MKLNVIKKAFKMGEKSKRVSYVIITIIIISFAFYSTVSKYDINAGVIDEKYEKRDSIVQEGVYSIELNIPEIKQLKEQFRIITEIKKYYLYVAKSYIKFNYPLVIFFSIFSILSGILGFLLIQKGWANTQSFYLKASFLIVFFYSTLFGILPNVFATKENIKNNLSKYNYYNGLQLDIYELLKDNKGYIKRRNNIKSLDSLNKEISLITQGIKANQNLYFDIHIDKVPTENVPLK